MSNNKFLPQKMVGWPNITNDIDPYVTHMDKKVDLKGIKSWLVKNKEWSVFTYLQDFFAVITFTQCNHLSPKFRLLLVTIRTEWLHKSDS